MSMLSGDTRSLSYDAYIYLYPLVTMEVTRRQAVNVEPDTKPGFGPPNQFHHLRTFPTADFRAVVRPNFDTLYSSAWLDLTEEPAIVSAPDTAGRYYLLPLMDMWTDVFAAPGKRTSGTSACDFAVVPPGWQGRLPDGVQTIQSPTRYVWIIGRTQTNGKDDYANVHKFQNGMKVGPWHTGPGEPEAAQLKVDPAITRAAPEKDAVNLWSQSIQPPRGRPPT